LTELFIGRANHCIFGCLLSGRELEVICIVIHNHKGGNMARIVHLALKVDDLEKSSEFYEKLFGFVPVEEGKVRDHTSRHLTDGAIDLALIKYDAEESAESLASGQGPCIHHFGIEVEDLDQYASELARFGCQVISDPGVVPIKFRAPGGTVAEIVPSARYKKPASE